MEPCQVRARNCKIPYTSAAAAVETLSEPTLPRRGRVGSLNVSAAAAALVYGILQLRDAP